MPRLVRDPAVGATVKTLMVNSLQRPIIALPGTASTNFTINSMYNHHHNAGSTKPLICSTGITQNRHLAAQMVRTGDDAVVKARRIILTQEADP